MAKPLNLVDLAKHIGTFPTDLGKPDWSLALQTALQIGSKPGETPLIPNGRRGAPTIVRIPEMLNAVSPIEPYRSGARHIHLIADEGAGFHFRTLGPGNANAEQSIARAIKEPAYSVELDDKYRERFLLGPVGGHGWKAKLKLIGPKLPGMPWRSPSGFISGGDHSRNCLEAQHAFRPTDFGKQRTAQERYAGVHGWDLSECDFGFVWGDAISPTTDKPNDKPCEGLYVLGSYFHDLGRIGILINQLREWHVTWSTFGGGIPSSIVHMEPAGSGRNIIGDGRLDYCVIQSGGYTVHVSGETVELDGLTVDRVTRRDKQNSVYIDMGPKLPDGRMRGRNITVTNNVHDRWVNGPDLGYYQLCQDVTHTGNSGPISKQVDMNTTLYQHGSVRIKLGPNGYKRLPK